MRAHLLLFSVEVGLVVLRGLSRGAVVGSLTHARTGNSCECKNQMKKRGQHQHDHGSQETRIFARPSRRKEKIKWADFFFKKSTCCIKKEEEG
jgi:hypothetical protein